jgi:GNAT superfamily N-acetyltransferase
MSVAIRRLEPGDDRDRFCSGQPDLDRFFQRFAGQNQFRHHVGVTYIAVEDDAILGFVTVSPSEVEIDALPADRRRRLPRYPLPTLRLARLAVAQSAQGRGVGQAQLRFALTLARRMADEIGCVGIVVDAKPEAQTFYRRYGFESVAAVEGVLLDRPEPTPMFLPLSAIPRPDNQ